MRKNLKLSRFTAILPPVSCLLSLTLLPGAIAQTPPLCEVNENTWEEPSPRTRTIVLKDWGMQVDIPRNYRTMKRQDGSIEILHPQDYAMIQCIHQGGNGGHGYYSESIRPVTRQLHQSLQEQARWLGGWSEDEQGKRHPLGTLEAYNNNGFKGYLVFSPSNYSVAFIGTFQGQRQLWVIDAACDCEVDRSSLVDLLQRIHPLP